MGVCVEANRGLQVSYGSMALDLCQQRLDLTDVMSRASGVPEAEWR